MKRLIKPLLIWSVSAAVWFTAGWQTHMLKVICEQQDDAIQEWESGR